MTSICAEREAGQLEHLARRRRRAEAHDPRRDAGGRHADDARARRQAVLRRGAFAGDQQRAGAVVDAGRVAGGHRAVGPHDALQLRERLERGLARMLVLRDDDRLALLLRDRDRRRSRRRRSRDFCAATAFCWLRQRHRGPASSRSILKSAATFSAVSGIESTP